MTALASLDLPGGRYEVDDDPARLDLDVIHGFLRASYWSPGVPRDVLERAIGNSLAVGLYAPDGRQVGFARAVTDRATFAWVADVFVLSSERGLGLGLAPWLPAAASPGPPSIPAAHPPGTAKATTPARTPARTWAKVGLAASGRPVAATDAAPRPSAGRPATRS